MFWDAISTKIPPLTGLVERLVALSHATATGVVFSRQYFWQAQIKIREMKTKLVLIAAIFATLISSAQTNEPVVQVKFYSDPNATNQITFLEKGHVQSIRGVVDGTFPQSRRVLVSTMLPSVNEYGFQVFDAGGSLKWEETGNQIILANYPALEILTIGKTIDFAARKIGTIRGLKSDGTDSSRVLELWEYYTPPQPTPEQIAAAKAAQEKAKADAKAKIAERKKAGEYAALKFNQDSAAKGDSFGLMRMGERYRDGEGVEKDLVKARNYFEKSFAADTNNFIAKEELSKLPNE